MCALGFSTHSRTHLHTAFNSQKCVCVYECVLVRRSTSTRCCTIAELRKCRITAPDKHKWPSPTNRIWDMAVADGKCALCIIMVDGHRVRLCMCVCVWDSLSSSSSEGRLAKHSGHCRIRIRTDVTGVVAWLLCRCMARVQANYTK